MKERLSQPSSNEEDTQSRLLAELFDKHADELFRHCLLRLSDRDRALELTQETYLRAARYLNRGEELRNARAFLYRILNNLIVDEYRKWKSQSLDALLENEESSSYLEHEYLKDPVDTLEEAMVRFDGARALDALRTLEEPYKSAIVFRYIDGLSPTEIANATGEQENAVSVRIHRALKKLRAILEQNP